MELQLKNIGMIKEANVAIDGLTVIAGENDTGKSTVGKALFFIQEFQEKFFSNVNYQQIISEESKFEEELSRLQDKLESFSSEMDKMDEFTLDDFNDISKATSSMSTVASKVSKLTKKMERYIKILEFISKNKNKSDDELDRLSVAVQLKNISTQFKDFFYFGLDSHIHFILKSDEYKIGIEKENIVQETYSDFTNKPIIFIETPILSNLFSFFSKLDTIQTDIEYKINDYPYTLRSLYKQLKLPLEDKSNIDKSNILKNINSFINGDVSIGSGGNLIFKRDGEEHNILSVATGIKTFGIFQMLLENNYLDKDSILILDEPEVHLHPKWQLEMAKIIVELVKNGIKIVVNSHSPYMIQALIKYARDKEIVDKSNFYLTKKENDSVVINNVNDELNKIFELLAEPMNEVFEL